MSLEPQLVRAIFLDVGGTLYSCSAMDQQYPLRLYSLLSATKGLSFDDAKELFTRTERALKGERGHTTKVHVMEALGYSRDQVHAAYGTVDPARFLSPSPALSEMLAVLGSRFPLGIISNYRLFHVRDILEALQIPEVLFSWMITEDTVREIKPSKEPFLRAIELAQRPPEECVFVGDSPTKDMRPAKQAGMKTILVLADPSVQDCEFADASVESIMSLGELFRATH
jgi:FMN phosphatase YigB (HAD superfamily)